MPLIAVLALILTCITTVAASIPSVVALLKSNAPTQDKVFGVLLQAGANVATIFSSGAVPDAAKYERWVMFANQALEASKLAVDTATATAEINRVAAMHGWSTPAPPTVIEGVAPRLPLVGN